MTNWLGSLPNQIGNAQSRRRTLLQASGVAGALLIAGVPVVALADSTSQSNAADNNGKIHHGNFPVSGSTQGGATFSGLLHFTQFSAQQGTPNQLIANGLLSGTFKDASGATVATLQNAAFSAPVTNIDPPAACQVLNLVLGPLTLNLLGLVVTIPNPIILNITAVPGAGNLLGNLLCAVVNLLNPGGLAGLLGNLTALQGLVTALNSLFTALNAL